jgi:hypothetical protein
MKKLSGHLVSGQGFKPRTPEYKTGVLRTPQLPSARACVHTRICLSGGKILIHMHEYAPLNRLKYIL